MSFTQNGLHVLFGTYNSGKSSIIADLIKTNNNKSKTLVFDLELRGWSSLENDPDLTDLEVLHAPSFAESFTDMFAPGNDNKPSKYYIRLFNWILQQLDQKAQGKEVIIFDTAIALENGLKDLIEEKPSNFGWGGPDNSKGVVMESDILRPAYRTFLQKLFVDFGVKQVFLVFQIRTPWEKKLVVGERAKLAPGEKLDLQGRIGIYRQEAASIVWLVPDLNKKSNGIVIKERSGKSERKIPTKILAFNYEKMNDGFWENEEKAKNSLGELTKDDLEMIGDFAERDKVQEQMFKKILRTEELQEQEQEQEQELEMIDPVENHTKEIIFTAQAEIKEAKEPDKKALAKSLQASGVEAFDIAERLGVTLKAVKELLK